MVKRLLFLFSLIFLLAFISGCAEKDRLADGSKLINKDTFVYQPQESSNRSVTLKMI
jgi:polar amino acid transport system substrate-binding protein